MQIKYNTRWYIDPIMQRKDNVALGYGLYQSNSKIAIAFFPDLNEGTWVAHKLNSGRELCIAISNLINIDDWLKGNNNVLVEDTLRALVEYKRYND
jgi:hypothetical protein